MSVCKQRRGIAHGGFGMMNNSEKIKLKIVLLGESSVGKSSLVLRFVRGEFVTGSLPTVSAGE